MYKLFLLISLLLFNTQVIAISEPLILKNTERMSKTDFAQQIEQIRSEIKPGGRYEFINDAENHQITVSIDQINAILSKHGDSSPLSQTEKIAIYNAQEEINAILKRRDGERLICENVQQIGSHKRQVVCQTYADQERKKQQDRDTIRRIQSSNPESTGPAR